MQHNSVNLDIFSQRLIDMMGKRIKMFVKYMKNELNKYPDKSRLQSKRQWMMEYKKWISKDNIEKEILDYLVD